jgi:D-beta-D-heptose 7-phosphate kinase/D-beta-D-heptose 1-phosphate adenosyltransferase
MKILIIGESCRDIFHYGECNRLCPEAPVPVFNSKAIIENEGMARNVQKNLNSLGATPDLCTNDNWREVTKTRFIDTRVNHMFMRLDVNDDKVLRTDVQSIDFAAYDAVVISDYNKGFLTEEDIEYISLQNDCTFLDTKKQLGLWCGKIRFIKINNVELEKSRQHITREIEEKVISTHGSRGAKHKGIVYPVDEVGIKDTSGAGDTFLAGLVYKYLEVGLIESAISFANSCATSVVQKKGVSIV